MRAKFTTFTFSESVGNRTEVLIQKLLRFFFVFWCDLQLVFRNLKIFNFLWRKNAAYYTPIGVLYLDQGIYPDRYTFLQAGHFPTNGRNSPTWGNFTLCRRKYILPRREKMSIFASVFTVAEKSHFDNSSTFKTNQYSIYVCFYQHPKWLQLVRIPLQRFITRTFAMGCTILEVNFDK